MATHSDDGAPPAHPPPPPPLPAATELVPPSPSELAPSDLAALTEEIRLLRESVQEEFRLFRESNLQVTALLTNSRRWTSPAPHQHKSPGAASERGGA